MFLASKPIPCHRDAQTEAHESVAYLPQMLDTVARQGEKLSGFVFKQRDSLRSLFVEPDDVRCFTTKRQGHTAHLPLIPVAYSVHEHPGPEWIAGVIASTKVQGCTLYVYLTRNTWYLVRALLETSPLAPSFTFSMQAVASNVKYSLFMPFLLPNMSVVPSEIMAWTREQDSHITSKCEDEMPTPLWVNHVLQQKVHA